MRCFSHQEREAVGLCKQCQKGLCPECATDLGYGLACKGVHEEAVTSFDQMIGRSAKMQGVSGRMRYAAPLFYAFMGSVFAGFALLTGQGFLSLGVVFGLGCLVFAVIAFMASRKAYASWDARLD